MLQAYEKQREKKQTIVCTEIFYLLTNYRININNIITRVRVHIYLFEVGAKSNMRCGDILSIYYLFGKDFEQYVNKMFYVQSTIDNKHIFVFLGNHFQSITLIYKLVVLLNVLIYSNGNPFVKR